MDPESLSPGPDSVTSPNSVIAISNGVDDTNDHKQLLEEKSDQNVQPSSPKRKSFSNKRCRKLLLRLRSNDSNSNKEACFLSTSPSPVSDSMETVSPGSSRDCQEDYKVGDTTTLSTKSSPSVLIDSVEPEESLRSCRVTAASENDIPSLQTAFSESEKENLYQEPETETEEGSSLPLSPAGPSTAGLSSSTVPYYNFLCVNGGAMRQEMTSTSSPQLSSGTNLRSNEESPSADVCSSFGSEKNSRIDTLKPESLDSSFSLPAARSCPNLERQSAGYSSTSGSILKL